MSFKELSKLIGQVAESVPSKMEKICIEYNIDFHIEANYTDEEITFRIVNRDTMQQVKHVESALALKRQISLKVATNEICRALFMEMDFQNIILGLEE